MNRLWAQFAHASKPVFFERFWLLLKLSPQLKGFITVQARGSILQAEFKLLVRDCLAGHPLALRDLVHQFQAQVFGLCFRMLRHRQDAEDATQETFVRVINNLHRWDPEREFAPWLLTIAGNRCRTRLSQRSSRLRTQSLDYPVADRSHLEHDKTHLAEEIELAIGELRAQHKECFLMFHQKEMPYAEIAQTMGVPLGTVKTWVHRARYEIIRRLRHRGVIADELPTF